MDHTFEATDVPFDDSERSGSGGWEFEQGAAIEGRLMLRFRETRTSMEVRTRRNLGGDLHLRVIDNSDDQYLEYRKDSGC
ncbi:hypothetical protein ONA70_32430 [Micromonospora yasonensis]|uniref:hypothetical protein n=1 Tax=Micromonospora yasonensis TaxID=1128667 RepID=UPI0022324327|nr:hypothetical protein [Micromonospora yasonensis]MCW3844797.1 hypothetical protein [Micromonospora yasonensis]